MLKVVLLRILPAFQAPVASEEAPIGTPETASLKTMTLSMGK
jgi:hypothetical protein